MSYLLDINFYNKLPIWIYISTGFGIFLVLNTSCLCCYSCKYKKKLEKLKLKEFDGIVLTKPIMYSNIV